MTEADIAWAAGIVDGEGCVFINKSHFVLASRQVSYTYRGVLKVTMGCKTTVNKLRDIFEVGTTQVHVRKNDRVNDSFSWICQSSQAEYVYKLIRPYSITKAKEIDIISRFFALPLNARGGNGGSKVMDPELLKKREELYWELRQAKSRWRFYEEKMGLEEKN